MTHQAKDNNSIAPTSARGRVHFRKLHRYSICGIAVFVALFFASIGAMQCNAQERVSRVIPTLEIEILDPNKDARGNPAVVVKQEADGTTQVDIPPTLIVHRYYYTGDRSFRGPDMPGGPCIVVAHHPKSGEKLYLPIQMLPGSPEVRYTARSIEYNYGDRAVLITFPHIGKPVVSYRNGKTLQDRVVDSLKLPQIKSGVTRTNQTISQTSSKVKLAGSGIFQASKEAIRPLTLPMQNLSRLVPGVVPLSDPSLASKIQEEKALSERDREIQRARCLNSGNEVDIPRP